MLDYRPEEPQLLWNDLKNRRLKALRGKGFPEVLSLRRLCQIEHPTRPGQVLILYEDSGRVWVIPGVVVGRRVFLKTLYQSRKYTAKFQRGEL